MTQTPDTKPGNYYVTARNDAGQHVFLAGPFQDNHQAALDLVAKARAEAEKVDPRAIWYSYGTARTEPDYAPLGKLNTQLGVTP